MTDRTLIVVEGKEDKNFLESYIKNLGYSDENFECRSICGRDKLKGYRNDIENALDKGEKVLIVFDADLKEPEAKSPYENARIYIEGELKGLEGFKIFLFPDDSSTGAVEDLLEKIINSEHERIFECFEEYKQCIREYSEYNLPNMKAKIFAYKEALDILKKNTFDSRYWDFESTALKPLKSFLNQNL